MCNTYRFLRKAPEVFALGLVWDSPNSTTEDITELIDMISLRIDLSNVFSMKNVRPRDAVPFLYLILYSFVFFSFHLLSFQRAHTYKFRGMICYYGLHYIAYFYNCDLKQWFSFDDANVKEVHTILSLFFLFLLRAVYRFLLLIFWKIGADWPSIRERCIKGRMQPSVLFYEKEDKSHLQQLTGDLTDTLSRYESVSDW